MKRQSCQSHRLLPFLALFAVLLLFACSSFAQVTLTLPPGGGGGATRFLELADFAAPITYTDGLVLRANGTTYTSGRLAATDLSDAATLLHLAGAEAVSGVKDFLVYPTGPSTPATLDNQFVTKAYVDTSANGLKLHTAVRVISTADITLATAVENGDTLNGVTLATGDRVGVLFQTAGETNGIYVVKASGAPDRATDYDTAGEACLGSFFNVLEGTLYSNTQWSNSTVGVIELGTTPLTFSQLSKPQDTTASLGVQKVGNDFRLNYSANQGLKLNGNATEIDYDNTSLGIVSNKLAIKAGGITPAKFPGTATAGFVPVVQGDGTFLLSSQTGGGSGVASAANGNFQLLSYNYAQVQFGGGLYAVYPLTNSYFPIVTADLTNCTQYKVNFTTYTSKSSSIVSATAQYYKIWVQYSTDAGVNWVNLDGSETDLLHGIGDTGALTMEGGFNGTAWVNNRCSTTATWINLATLAKAQVQLRVVTARLNGSTTNQYVYLCQVNLMLNSPAAATVNTGSTAGAILIAGDTGGANIAAATPTITTGVLSLPAATPLVLGAQAATNVPGGFKMLAAGSNSAYYNTITSGTNSANATYTLPTAMPAGTYLLNSTNAGVMGWTNPATYMTTRTGVVRTLAISAGAIVPATTNGATKGTYESPTNKETSDYQEFSASVEKYADFDVVMPEEWNNGTVKVKFIWTNGESGGTGNCIWGAEAVAVSNDDALDASFGTPQEVTDAIITDGDNHTTAATAALTIAGTPASGDVVRFRFYRKAADGSDTYDKKAWLKYVVIQYTESTTEPSAW